MTQATISVSAAKSLAIAATATYKKKIAGYPEIDEGKLVEAMTIVQRGVTSEGILTSDKQRREASNLLKEENTRRGLEKCMQRANQLYEFFAYCSEFATTVAIGFDDWVLLACAKDASASDFN